VSSLSHALINPKPSSTFAIVRSYGCTSGHLAPRFSSSPVQLRSGSKVFNPKQNDHTDYQPATKLGNQTRRPATQPKGCAQSDPAPRNHNHSVDEKIGAAKTISCGKIAAARSINCGNSAAKTSPQTGCRAMQGHPADIGAKQISQDSLHDVQRVATQNQFQAQPQKINHAKPFNPDNEIGGDRH
jgi:hypothetical protein